MLKRLLLLAFFLIGLNIQLHASYYEHPTLHLIFDLNEQTKEAIVGTGVAEERTAYAYPNIADPNYINKLNEYAQAWRNIVIPGTITSNGETYTVVGIAQYAFHKATEINSIVLPETIVSIGQQAFSWCVNLKKVNIPSSITEIKESTFYLCQQLESIVLPQGLKKISGSAFRECWNLKKINIPGSCIEIGNEAFTWCTSLSNISFDAGNEPLKCGYSYELGINNVDPYAKPVYRGLFAEAPADTIYIGRDTLLFPQTQEGKYLNLFESISQYPNQYNPNYYFSGKSFKKVTFYENISTVQDMLFSNSEFNTELILPKGLTHIGDGAFYSSKFYGAITLPERLEYIGDGAFNLISQDTLIIPKSVTHIGKEAFGACDIKKFVLCLPNTPPSEKNPFGQSPIKVANGTGSIYRSLWEEAFIIDSSEEFVTINVKTPGSFYSRLLAQGYQLDNVYKLELKGSINDEDLSVLTSMTKIYDYDLSELKVEELPVGFFQGKDKLFQISLPNTLTRINENEFKDCIRLEGIITIPKSCHSIGEYAFANTNLRGLSLQSEINIGKGIFEGCNIESIIIPSGSILQPYAFTGSGLKNITLAEGVKNIGEEALGESIKTITFNGMIESIGAHTYPALSHIYVSDAKTWCELPFPNHEIMKSAPQLFIGNDLAKDVIIPENTRLRDYAFFNCKTLHSVSLPMSVSEIPSGFFNNCSNLSSVELPETLLKIGAATFAGCSALTNLYFPTTIEEVCDSAFYGCAQLSNIQYPDFLKKIGNYAFYGCRNLTTINLPNSLETIGSFSFYGNSAIEKIKFPLSLYTIGEQAFSQCKNLREIRAQWQDPFTISENTFQAVASNCYLYVPIMTANKYHNAGWQLPNLKEAGILSISVKGEGEILYESNFVKNKSEEFLFSPYKSFYLTINPEEGHSIRKIKLNGKNAMSLIENGKILIEEPEENIEISFVFGDNSIKNGDVNGDGVIDKNDAILLMHYIVKNESDKIYDYASDMNEDDIIDVTDTAIIIDNILKMIDN